MFKEKVFLIFWEFMPAARKVTDCVEAAKVAEACGRHGDAAFLYELALDISTDVDQITQIDAARKRTTEKARACNQPLLGC